MTRTIPVNTRFTENEYRRLRALADAETRSFANMLQVLVLEALAAREAKAAEK
jgi:hypothetical protein